MALRGIKVLEFVGLAPGPFCGKILADFGATVTRIDKAVDNNLDVLQNGKRTLAVDLKSAKGQQLVRQLASTHDVIIEPFRPGVMEKLNLGPKVLCEQQPRLIYARLTGFGQSGRLSQRAGHDINYVAISGILSMLGRHRECPAPPLNLLADFAGGGLMCALGICLALLERHQSGRGQVVDAAMIDGAAYVSSWLHASRALPMWGKERGSNVLDGGKFFYGTYETKDGKYMSVGPIEPQFFEILKDCLGLPELVQYVEDDEQEAAARKAVRAAFLEKTQAEWSRVFEDVDACVYPVLEWQEVMQHDHHRERDSFELIEDIPWPKPAPRLSRTPGQLPAARSTSENVAEEAFSILKELNLSESELRKLVDEAVIVLPMGYAKI